MQGFIESLLNTVKSFIDSVISKKDRSYFDLAEGESSVSVRNPIRDFLSEKVRIKFNLQISRGMLILLISGIVLLLIFVIRGILKNSRSE